MKKFIFPIILIICLVGIVAIFSCYNSPEESEQGLGGSYSGTITCSSTSTAPTDGGMPVKILSTNAARQYARIQNDSTSEIYLYLGYFEEPEDASTTSIVGEGILLCPRASSTCANHWEINDINQYKGQVWASSTVADQSIIYIEK